MLLGPRDTRSLIVLPGIDADELAKYKNEVNVNYADIASLLTAGLSGVLGEIEAMYSGLISSQEELDVEYRTAATTGFTPFTEYTPGQGQRGDTTGHMLPLKADDRVLNWTWLYLRKAKMSQIEADITQALDDTRKLFRTTILSRVLRIADDTGSTNGLGTSGVSPGLVNPASAIAYTPVPFGGQEFPSHSHYNAYNNSGSFTVAMLDDAKADMVEHGIMGPYELLISPTDESQFRALTGFTATPSPLIRYGDNVSLAAFSETEQYTMRYIGVIGDFAIRVVPGWPTTYAFAYARMGANNPKNPLRMRLPKGGGPVVFAMTDPRAGTAHTPMQNLMLFSEFGVGVGDNRTNGVAIYTNSATWADATVS